MEKESKWSCQKNRHFFKVFLPGLTSEMLEVPPGFRKHMDGGLRRCALMGPSGNAWTVELVRTKSGGLFFGKGWKEFTEDHAVEIGEFLVFIYEGGSHFRVLVFDTSACEKEAAFRAFPSNTIAMEKAKDEQEETFQGLVAADAAADALAGLTTNIRKNQGKSRSEEEEGPHAAGRMKQKELALPRAGAPKKIYSRKRRSRGMLVSQRRPVTKEEIERAHRAACAFVSHNPFQVMVMRKSGIYLGHSMPLPHNFAKYYLPKSSQKITLSDCEGNSWQVTYLPLDGTYILSAGWRQFSIDNNLEQDDACVFELIKKDEIRVHIFRVVQEVTPLIRKIIRNCS